MNDSSRDTMFEGVHDNGQAAERPNQSAFVALAAVVLSLLAALAVYLVSAPAGWFAGVAVVLVGVGAPTGSRGPVGVGVGILAVSSLFATRTDASLGALGFSALIAGFCVAILVSADFSFAMRRAAVVSQETVLGFVAVHAASSLLGISLAVVLLGGVLAVTWPGWLLLLPATLLGGAAIFLAREAHRYNRKLRVAATPAGAQRLLPPPPPGIKSTMPPPPAPGAQPTRRLPPPPPRQAPARRQPPPPRTR